jgi:hypothetical protein
MRIVLAHAWSSSVAAFHATVRRALHHAAAMDDALAEGRWPTRREMRAWVTTAESSQLAFAALVAAPASGDCSHARTVLAQHVHALETLRIRLARMRDDDTAARAALLRRVLTTHPDTTVIAFSRYAATIDALWRALRCDAGVVAITARSVRSAGGGLSRPEVLSALASPAARDARTPLRLVLSTDLLGEGLDLLAASVVVHLDQPWTPARLDQREGRALRLGSPHETVTTYALRPPRGAARLLALATRLHHKRAAMNTSVAAGDARESLLHFVRPWLAAPRGAARLAAVRAGIEGWVAVVRDATGHERVIVGNNDVVVEDDARLLDVLERVECGAVTKPIARCAEQARRRIRQWLRADGATRLIHARVDNGGSRATVARRLDSALRAAPLHQRAVLQARIVAVQARVAVVRGAGSERALAAAAQCETLSGLLDAVETIDAPPHDRRPAARGSRLLALLLLVPDERDDATGSPPPPCSLHAAACSGTAAPR